MAELSDGVARASRQALKQSQIRARDEGLSLVSVPSTRRTVVEPSFTVQNEGSEDTTTVEHAVRRGLEQGLSEVPTSSAMRPVIELTQCRPHSVFHPSSLPPVETADPDEERRRAALDHTQASLIEMLYGNPELEDTELLLGIAWRLHDHHFLRPSGPRTRIAAARALTAIYRTLRERALSAPRDPSGVLLRSAFGDLVPWTSLGARQLEDISPFSPENVIAWIETGATPVPTHRPRTPSRRILTHLLEEQAILATSLPRSQTEPSTLIGIGTEIQEQPLSLTERAAEDTGGAADVQGGIRALRSATIGQAISAISARLGEKSGESAPGRGVRLHHVPDDKVSLLDAARHIWYLANRLYVLDRFGHIESEEFQYDVSAVQLTSGTYFIGHFQLTYASGSTGRPQATPPVQVLLRVDGGPKVAYGEIYPTYTLRGLIPLLEQGQAALSANAGIAIIVSPSRERELPSFDVNNLTKAVLGAGRHLPWIIRSRVMEVFENPTEVLLQGAMGLALEALAKLIPPARLALSVFEAIRLAEWLGTTGSIALYARTEDEIDIASQTIARQFAEWAIGEVVQRARRGAARLRRGQRIKPTGDPPTVGSETGGTGAPEAEPTIEPGRRPAAPPAAPEAEPTIEPGRRPAAPPAAPEAEPTIEPGRRPAAIEALTLAEELEHVADVESLAAQPLQPETFELGALADPGHPVARVSRWQDVDTSNFPQHLLLSFQQKYQENVTKIQDLISKGKRKRPYMDWNEYLHRRWGYESEQLERALGRRGRTIGSEVGALAEDVWSNITQTPKNPGRRDGGEFWTPHGNVQPDFIPAVDERGQVVFARERNYAKAEKVASIDDALLVADSKFLGAFRLRGDIRTITFSALRDHADQIKGMIWLSQYTQSRTFVLLARVGQTLGEDVIEFARGLNVEIRIHTHALVGR